MSDLSSKFQLELKHYINAVEYNSSCVIIRARVVLKRTVVSDCRFDIVNESHLQSQVNSVTHWTIL